MNRYSLGHCAWLHFGHPCETTSGQTTAAHKKEAKFLGTWLVPSCADGINYSWACSSIQEKESSTINPDVSTHYIK